MNKRRTAVFILTHGRADNVKTYNTLRKCGYTGDIYIVIDDEDDQEDAYRQRYGDKVVQFCKEEYLQRSMCINPSKPRKVILYARNACFDIAKSLGITHFIEMDDDYTCFQYRYQEGEKLRGRNISCLDEVIDAFFDFLESTPLLTCAFSQTGDLLGGVQGDWSTMEVKRKAMNAFFCMAERPINFIGSINEDVNTYVHRGNIGDLFLTVLRVTLEQTDTQSSKGGMTETYLDNGTYVKSFPTVILNPSCVKVAMMRSNHARLHHKIKWGNAVPKILSERYRRG